MITVSSFREADALWRDHGAVISIEDPDTENRFRMPEGDANPDHLVLQFDDVDQETERFASPEAAQIAQALEFARAHADKRLLVHCQAGQCRSAAIALAVIAERLGPGREAEAVAKLLEIRPIAAPNLIALALADAMLGRNGALQAAWMAHEADDERILRMRFLKTVVYDRAQRHTL